MNRIDIAILVGVFIFSLAGYFRGLLREGISLLSSVGGFLAAVWKTNSFASFFCSVLPWPDHIVFIGVFALILFPGTALIEIVLLFFYNQIKTSSRNVVEKSTGCVLGFFRGIVLASLLTLLLPLVSSGTKMLNEKNKSLLLKPIRVVAPAFLEWTAGWLEFTRSNYPEVKSQFSQLDPPKSLSFPGTNYESDNAK
jgi:uncharacterized membrane protein required for colicin V production